MCERIHKRAAQSWRLAGSTDPSDEGPTLRAQIDHLLTSALAQRCAPDQAKDAEDTEDEAFIAATVRLHLEHRQPSRRRAHG